jgi:hypothetical protein
MEYTYTPKSRYPKTFLTFCNRWDWINIIISTYQETQVVNITFNYSLQFLINSAAVAQLGRANS